jgi:hypothetical protein
MAWLCPNPKCFFDKTLEEDGVCPVCGERLKEVPFSSFSSLSQADAEYLMTKYLGKGIVKDKISAKQIALKQGSLYECKYVGGHSIYPDSKDVYVYLRPQYVVIPEFRLQIPYEKIRNIQTKTAEELSAARIFLIGLIAWGLKKKTPLMILTYEDELGIEQNLTFHIGQVFFSGVDPKLTNLPGRIYKKMLEARKESLPAKTDPNVPKEEPKFFLDEK